MAIKSFIMRVLGVLYLYLTCWAHVIDASSPIPIESSFLHVQRTHSLHAVDREDDNVQSSSLRYEKRGNATVADSDLHRGVNHTTSNGSSSSNAALLNAGEQQLALQSVELLYVLFVTRFHANVGLKGKSLKKWFDSQSEVFNVDAFKQQHRIEFLQQIQKNLSSSISLECTSSNTQKVVSFAYSSNSSQLDGSVSCSVFDARFWRFVPLASLLTQPYLTHRLLFATSNPLSGKFSA